MDYTTWLTTVSTMTSILEGDDNLDNVLGDAIDYGELRIYRELNLLNTGYRDDSGSLASGNRSFTLPTPVGGTWLVVSSINCITPAGVAPDSGTRNQLTKTTQEIIDIIGTAAAQANVPAAFAMLTDTTLVVAPFPNGAYRMEVIGTLRPTKLSATNTTTILTANFPDLFLAATMVFLAGYMQNYGAQSDDPKQAQSWENQYQQLKASAATEEGRKKVTSFSGRQIGGEPRGA